MLAIDTQLELPLPGVHDKIKVTELRYAYQDLQILEMGQEFCKDVDLNEHVDVDTLLMSCIHVRNDIERKGTNVFIAYRGDKPIGFLVGVASSAFHRLGIVAEQKLCYVVPAARGTLAVKLLVREFEQWARLNGATQIFTGTANLRYAEKTSKLFEHLGYARVGALHVKEI